MTRSNLPLNRRSGFTLIELLTVVAIISLLIGILLPSLARARDQAKNAKILGMLRSIEGALEMFHNDFGQYPDSRRRSDPITDWPALGGITPPDGADLTGAHWLARALYGHDSQGVDINGRSMGDGSVTANQIQYATLATTSRKAVYFSGKVFFRDNDISSGVSLANPTTDFIPPGRMMVIEDSFKSPVLYYRANERASNPFCLDGNGQAAPGSSNDMPGVYRLRDNNLITGDAANNIAGWDFANAGRQHWLAIFGTVNPANPQQILSQPAEAKSTFARYLHDPNALSTSNIIKPMRPDSFVLITAGKDGLYGTDDDVNNFNTAR
ncbi:MAG TPA: prepilin-type N-terminal cleavage/methylation domain-containing protein [Phycisphaerae bacterium]|nr:prepilin-type N-terminal cleavage/methylation domain-containing protein [Phycisphaerae bacterium]